MKCGVNDRAFVDTQFSLLLSCSAAGSTQQTILCGVTTVRLVSSGQFDNAVTVTLRPAGEDDILSANLICSL
jgi:hypothetical protein